MMERNRDKETRQFASAPETVREAGQTMVILAFALIALLAFVGIAVDVGFAFVRSSQFSAAVDAAALAAAMDLDPEADNLDAPNQRAEQFLATNGWPTDTMASMVSTRTLTIDGVPEYGLTVTWPLELFFLKIVGITEIPVTRSATAAYYAASEMYTASAFERGHIRKASQFIFGDQACTRAGDPVSPKRSTPSEPNPNYSVTEGTYRYRILIPKNYTETTHIDVELFDPDGTNATSNSAIIVHSVAYGGDDPPATSPGSCSGGPGERCVIDTGESLELEAHNPFWFVRVDEAWDADCNAAPGNNNAGVTTRYALSYLDATGQKQSLGVYTALPAHAPLTDMRWVTPGITPGVTTDHGSFRVEVASIPPTPSGSRYLQLEVTAEGLGKNVWDLRAGPAADHYYPPLHPEVNQRNLQLANMPANYEEHGIRVFALGRMPVQHYYGTRGGVPLSIDLPLAPINSRQAGGSIYATAFDFDLSPPPPQPVLAFWIDMVSRGDFYIRTEVVAGEPLPIPPPPQPRQVTCDYGMDCNNSWLMPQIAMGVPENIFFGGTLFATYTPLGNGHTWYMSVTTGRPILTR
jgi:hypothetical protein